LPLAVDRDEQVVEVNARRFKPERLVDAQPGIEQEASDSVDALLGDAFGPDETNARICG
jgi:hypothetical protein